MTIENLTQIEKVSLGAVILISMCSLLGIVLMTNALSSKEAEKALPLQATKISTEFSS